MARFPADIRAFAELFVEMQQQRYTADYDPAAVFPKGAVTQYLDDAAEVIHDFDNSPAKDRRAFAVYVLLDFRAS